MTGRAEGEGDLCIAFFAKYKLLYLDTSAQETGQNGMYFLAALSNAATT